MERPTPFPELNSVLQPADSSDFASTLEFVRLIVRESERYADALY